MKKWNVVAISVLFIGLPLVGMEQQLEVIKKTPDRESLAQGAAVLKRREIKRKTSSSEERASMSSSSEYLKQVTVAPYAGYPHVNSFEKSLKGLPEELDEEGSSFNLSFFGNYSVVPTDKG